MEPQRLPILVDPLQQGPHVVFARSLPALGGGAEDDDEQLQWVAGGADPAWGPGPIRLPTAVRKVTRRAAGSASVYGSIARTISPAIPWNGSGASGAGRGMEGAGAS